MKLLPPSAVLSFCPHHGRRARGDSLSGPAAPVAPSSALRTGQRWAHRSNPAPGILHANLLPHQRTVPPPFYFFSVMGDATPQSPTLSRDSSTQTSIASPTTALNRQRFVLDKALVHFVMDATLNIRHPLRLVHGRVRARMCSARQPNHGEKQCMRSWTHCCLGQWK